MSLSDGNSEYTHNSLSRWYRPTPNSLVEITHLPKNARSDAPVRLFIARNDGGNGYMSEYVSLDEAENFALNILAMVRDYRADLDKS